LNSCPRYCPSSPSSPSSTLSLQARILHELGFEIYSTSGTHRFLTENHVPSTLVHKPGSGKLPNAVSLISEGSIDLVDNTITIIIIITMSCSSSRDHDTVMMLRMVAGRW
jgi:hypothetical protein